MTRKTPKPTKKLPLERETLKKLDAKDLGQVAGGALLNSGKYCKLPSQI